MKRKLISIVSAAFILIGAVGFTACDEDSHKHTFSTDWTMDETHHWHVATCEHILEVSDKAEHNWGADNKCTDCGYENVTVNAWEKMTAEEWAAAFENSFNAECYSIAFSTEQSYGGQTQTVNSLRKKCGNVYYEKRFFGDESAPVYLREYYYSFNDATHSIDEYIYNEAEEAFEKTIRTFDSVEEYNERKAKTLNFVSDELYTNGTASGKLGALYSLVEFNEENGEYSLSNLKIDSPEETERNDFIFTFQDGKIASFSYVMTGEYNVNLPLTSVSYESIELLLPNVSNGE